jgi:hypothetical protein
MYLTVNDLVAALKPSWVSRYPRFFGTAASTATGRRIRLILAVLYWAWVLQAFLLQRMLNYVHMPETLMIFPILAMHRSMVLPVAIAVIAFGSTRSIVQYGWELPRENLRSGLGYSQRHPIADWHRTRNWWSCWPPLSETEARLRQDRVAHLPFYFPSLSVAELGEITDWLQARQVRANQVIAWHDSPHAVLLSLPGKAGFRFMHIDTPILSPITYEWMWQECEQAAPTAKYVIVDLIRSYVQLHSLSLEGWDEPSANFWPPNFPTKSFGYFPYNQNAVYRTNNGRGRYLILEMVRPLGVSEYHPGVDIWSKD